MRKTVCSKWLRVEPLDYQPIARNPLFENQFGRRGATFDRVAGHAGDRAAIPSVGQAERYEYPTRSAAEC